ncbi:uncharacterized protein N7518_008135 [Penicillium psychrosexuale]|uniref:uncharacterized protein n=1 Tax=Penicillium psychrosexuale TaxID=1002107 RepID=UPI0025455C9C|nr:uncharacterized protein N7518_008135 [Penicillium psychrosexuale]KAJ5791124.1 hypothetical protein N7518_008135 [Penicillium psychrosexuale]
MLFVRARNVPGYHLALRAHVWLFETHYDNSTDDIASQVISVGVVFTLFTGRLVQSVTSTDLQAVGFGTLADNVSADELGKMSGFMSIPIGIGTSGGPPAQLAFC